MPIMSSRSDEHDTAKEDKGVEVVDGGTSTSSTAATRRMDKNTQRPLRSARGENASSGVALYADPRDEDSLSPVPGGENVPTELGMEMEAMILSAMEGDEVYEEGSLPSDEALHDDCEEEDASEAIPMRHVVPRRAAGGDRRYADDVSSLHYSHMEVASYGDHRAYEVSPARRHGNANGGMRSPRRDDANDKSPRVIARVRREPRRCAAVEASTDDSDDEDRRRRRRRCRNALVIAVLVVLLGLVALIAVGVGFSLMNNRGSPDGGEEEEGGPGASASKIDDGNDGTGGALDDPTDPFDAASAPSSFPSNEGPCFPVEVGIIFDEYSGETSWMLVEGNYYPEDPDKNAVAWKSKFYDPSDYSRRADAFHNCFSPGFYTFVFADESGDGVCCDDGEGSYVLSSEGKIITVGGEMRSGEETFPFRLPYDEPEPFDSNGDGRDDRLGWIMPYDSSGMVEGVDCENFRLVIGTDNYGLETTWELFEGTDKSGTLVANGGPYGSEYNYVVDYCLASPKEYVLYVYDWDRRGLCCETGEGWYRVFSGNTVIRDSDGQFGRVDITQFRLPADV